MDDAYVFGGTYRDRCTSRAVFRVVNPMLEAFWERDDPLRVFTTRTLPGRRLDRCHLYRVADERCGAVVLVEENPEWVDRIGAPGMAYLADDARERLYRAYRRFVGEGDHG